MTEPDDDFDDDAPDLDLRGMVRSPDHDTSVAAAVHHVSGRTKLQERIYQILHDSGGLMDEQLWLLPEFAHYDQSTVRKRRSELYQAGLVVKIGVGVNSRGFKMTIWGVAPPRPPEPPPAAPKPRRSLYPTPPTVTPKRKRV